MPQKKPDTHELKTRAFPFVARLDVERPWTKEAAEVQHPHRFHDIRARALTEVAKVMPVAAQGAARHQDPATTSLYIGLASTRLRMLSSRPSQSGPHE